MEGWFVKWSVGLTRLRLLVAGVVGWVGGGPVLCATRGQADIRGFGVPQDHGSSWGAAV
jgi:hypothetical protein